VGFPRTASGFLTGSVDHTQSVEAAGAEETAAWQREEQDGRLSLFAAMNSIKPPNRAAKDGARVRDSISSG